MNINPIEMDSDFNKWVLQHRKMIELMSAISGLSVGAIEYNLRNIINWKIEKD